MFLVGFYHYYRVFSHLVWALESRPRACFGVEAYNRMFCSRSRILPKLNIYYSASCITFIKAELQKVLCAKVISFFFSRFAIAMCRCILLEWLQACRCSCIRRFLYKKDMLSYTPCLITMSSLMTVRTGNTVRNWQHGYLPPDVDHIWVWWMWNPDHNFFYRTRNHIYGVGLKTAFTSH